MDTMNRFTKKRGKMNDKQTILHDHARQDQAKFGAGSAARVAAAYYMELVRNSVPPAAIITGKWVEAAVISQAKK